MGQTEPEPGHHQLGVTKEQFDKRAVFCTQVPIASKEGYLASKEG